MIKTELKFDEFDDVYSTFEMKENLEEMDVENLSYYVMDLSVPVEVRIKALNILYEKEGADSVLEIVNRLVTMYETSNTHLLRLYLADIAKLSNIRGDLKIVCVKGMLTVNENDELAFEALNSLYPKLEKDLSTTFRFELLKTLMMTEPYKEQCKDYFHEILDNQTINCHFRYKLIVELLKKKTDENGETLKDYIIPNSVYFVKEASNHFMRNENNTDNYRLLAAQNILSFLEREEKEEKEEEKETQKYAETFLLKIASDSTKEYNLRADAADVLLRYSTDKTKNIAKEIIFELSGTKGKRTATIYQNAQNVHTENIEESVLKGLEFLQPFEIMKKIIFDNGRTKEVPITFEDVEKELLKISDEKTQSIVQISLNRIYTDSALYSKYMCNLNNILLRIWTYISGHKDSENLKKRLLEELVDMAGTCSSGFASRLINVISGFGDFSMTISWKDQIVANFSGRLNAKIRDLDDLRLQESILEQMTIESSDYNSRKNFLDFFREVSHDIKHDLWEEFKTHINRTDFDLWFRSAIVMYETGEKI